MSVWFITGAGRGMGLDIAKAALAAGHKVVATGRNTEKVAKAVGQSADLLVVKLDVTSPADAEAAVKATIERFGRIDVLVNNAASFYAGYFEELSPEQMDLQLATSLVGPMNVTRAVPAGHAQAAVRQDHLDLVDRGSSAASSSVPPTPPRSSASMAGWSRCRPRSRRSASRP